MSESNLPDLHPTAEDKVKNPEIFFGLVSPIGVGGGAVMDSLKLALEDVNYGLHQIRVIRELQHVESLSSEKETPFSNLENPNIKDRYVDCIRAGDQFCNVLGGVDGKKGQDALMALAIADIAEFRKAKWISFKEENPEDFARSIDEDEFDEEGFKFWPLRRQAYLFRSLKRPGEIKRLRAIYEKGFILISAHAPREHRINALARKIASSDMQFDPDSSRESAEKLLKLDLGDKENPAGQNVRKAFSEADFFIDASGTRAEIREQLRRFVAILFNYQFHTPTKDEYGMAMAHLASLRSAHFTRQVGAAIVRPDGTIVATGCNEVPRSGGGLYWPGDPDDQRDFQLRKNTSLDLRYEVLGDTLQRYLRRLQELGKISRDEMGELHRSLIEETRNDSRLSGSRIMDAIEYDRSVHAEMAAITDAARHGLDIKDCTIYTTTFPCHNCARHIVSSGIERAVYMHPYEKSLTKRLHGDAIGVDLSPETGQSVVRFDPFVGISPNLFIEFFSMGDRRGKGDRWRSVEKWDPKTSNPRSFFDKLLYTRAEEIALVWLLDRLQANDLYYARKET